MSTIQKLSEIDQSFVKLWPKNKVRFLPTPKLVAKMMDERDDEDSDWEFPHNGCVTWYSEEGCDWEEMKEEVEEYLQADEDIIVYQYDDYRLIALPSLLKKSSKKKSRKVGMSTVK